MLPLPFRSLLLAAAIAWLIASVHLVEADDTVDFNRDIRPLFSGNCLVCHGPDEDSRAADLRLDTQAGSQEDLGGYSAIVPGDPDASEIIARLTTDDADMRMPPEGKGRAFTPSDIELIRRWIDQGAHYAKHWSYVKPERPPLPAVTDERWPINPIDYFVLAKLEAENLTPSPEADRLTIARRVALDLTGLPPTWREATDFAHDRRSDAYEIYVDRLLAKPAFGERWASVWLDLARYADSAGYADDPRRTIWAYRDYVIRSLNENKPFDQFTIEQIAGDLIEHPSESQLIATAFHRNTMTNNEGGTNDEEFRNVAVVDRVNTTMAVWMGTTMACAQCHTHKYDPITQEEYFQFFDFFNQSEDSDKRDEQPVLSIWTDQQRQRRHEIQQRIARLKSTLDRVTPEIDAAQAAWLNQLTTPATWQTIEKPENDRTDQERFKFSAYYRSLTPVLANSRSRLETLQSELTSLKPDTSVPVMRDLPESKRRVTKIQRRGSYLSTGDEVSAGVPAALHDLQVEAGSAVDRMALARWLVDDDNPLTARVIANRHWEQVFGTGLVETSEDFGSQGEMPSHPELLDYLAVELRDGGWNLKQLLRLLVTSATYRQSSRVTAELLEIDPANRSLARGPRFRASAELVRDQALFVSGLLSDKMFGPPVQPEQPNLGLSAAFGSGTDWKTSSGEDRYRRGLYTLWRRSSPYPSMAQFDSPNREVCTVRRIRTNTPLQALVTLNDPVYIEAAQALARLAVSEQNASPIRVTFLFERVLLRDPSDAETDRLIKLVNQLKSYYDDHSDEAKQMATEPVGPLSDELASKSTTAELAAWTVLSNVILNLDETLMKR